ncbi:hypothetical protein [Marinovum sp.]|uniref:hypothetical protein n=1 Tax=Marinovum sp. TaxID=2024839 RepID=UPI003A9341FC
MPFNFNAVDTQFATATGAHVGTGDDRSHFDGPPSETTGLTITSHDGDSDPRLFEVGETYSVSYIGPNGPVTIANAVVMRSDAAPVDGSTSTTPTDAGVIVLSGLDQNGHES